MLSKVLKVKRVDKPGIYLGLPADMELYVGERTLILTLKTSGSGPSPGEQFRRSPVASSRGDSKKCFIREAIVDDFRPESLPSPPGPPSLLCACVFQIGFRMLLPCNSFPANVPVALTLAAGSPFPLVVLLCSRKPFY
uniref:Uncharacterized protein n=1 Tax=Nelumbo nucifera TaxID=4432 RepID=A0A822ZTY5_NELNU|nr:TPA_asm: hypothetical protein HUJ06_003568 [Nelumbo nucifera]